MLNGVDGSYLVVLIASGAVLLAAIYHSILYAQLRTRLLGRYSFYLWSTCAYCLFRIVYYQPEAADYRYFNPDEILQMTSFALYIRFIALALELHPYKEVYAQAFARWTPPLIFLYLVAATFFQNALPTDLAVYLVLKLGIRIYLLCFGAFLLVKLLRRRPSPFFHWLAAGGISMIAFGLLSTLVFLTRTEALYFNALAWLMLGFFTDVVFFSAAIGFRIRQDDREREASLKQLLRQEAELQQKELEKLKTVYDTREEERLRIARDLHDDMGGTLSSIGIYARVVQTYLRKDPDRAGSYLEKIQHHTAQLMETTSDLIWSLQNDYGEQTSLYKRMHQVAIENLSSANITPLLKMDPPERLPTLTLEARKNCWLIFKEAINNVCKYSQAKNCTVLLCLENGMLTLGITDDGIGISEPGKGNGIRNMQARAQALQGRFELASKPGEGTSAKAFFPLEKIIER